MSCTPHWYYIGNTSQYEGFPEQDQGQPQQHLWQMMQIIVKEISDLSLI